MNGPRSDRSGVHLLVDASAAVVLCIVVFAAYYRLRFGVNFTDEAYYAVLTQRFALGDRPYVDEINLRQTAALIAVPFYQAYLAIVGSTDGIIVFLRQLFFVLQLVVAGAVFRTARTRLPRAESLLAAALPLAFVPFALPTCSYNNLGAFLFALGTCIGLARILSPGPSWTMAVAGGIHTLACVAYPPLIVPVMAAMLATSFAVDRTRARAALIAYLLGLAAVGIFFFAIIVPGLVSGFGKALEYESMFTRERNLEKLGSVIASIVRLAPGKFISLPVLGIAWLAGRDKPAVRPYLLFAFVVCIAWWFREPLPGVGESTRSDTLSLHVAIYCGLLCGFLLALGPRKTARPVLLFAWAPSALAGIITGVASDNSGSMNVGIGLFAAATLMPFAATDTDDPAIRSITLGRLCVLAAIALVPLALVRLNFRTTYLDGPVSAQTSFVPEGPYRGMYTLPKKARLAESLARDIRPFHQPGQRMMVFFDLPAAYLAVPVRPALQISWTDSRAIIPPLLPYYQRHRTGHGLVVVVTGHEGRSRELEKLTEDPSRLLRNAGWIQVYREPPP